MNIATTGYEPPEAALDLDFDRFWELHAMDALRTANFEAVKRTAVAALGAKSACLAFIGRRREDFERRYDLRLLEAPLGVQIPDVAIDGEEVFVIDGPALDPAGFGEAARVDIDAPACLMGVVLRGSAGWPLGALCLFDDAPRRLTEDEASLLRDFASTISDRLETHRVMLRALRSEARLCDAVEAAADGFVLFDADDRLILSNKRHRSIYARSRPAFRPGARFEDILRYGLEAGQYPEAKGREKAWLAERLAAHREADSSVEQELPGDRWIRIVERRTSEGGLAGFRVDITELKRQQRELEQAKSALQHHRDSLERTVQKRTAVIEGQARELKLALEQERRLNTLQRSFVSMASHEFRTPLAIIDGALSRLRRQCAKLRIEGLDRYFDKIGGSVRRMLELIESTLSAARLEAGALEVAPQPCDLSKILGDCCARQAEVSATHGVTLVIDDLPERIMADPSALDQVFTNLLSNAVKYSKNADRVDVRARRQDGDLVVEVQDYGHGMDAEDVARVGERFFRAKSSTGIAGTGIGLNLVKALLAGHDGELQVASTLDGGSVFVVRLPIVTPDDGD